MFDLSGKRALVTGATGGIGESVARALHAQGASVAISGTRAEKLEALASDLKDRVHVTPCNLSDLEAVDALPTMPEPWLLFVTYNAPHEPLHVQPQSLHSYDLGPDATDLDHFGAAVEALDTEIGRLLEALEPQAAHTNVFFLSDNGSPQNLMVDPEPTGGKGSVRETGTRIPFVVRGPAVQSPGTESQALVHVVDLFPTLAELANVTSQPVDGLSLRPVLDGQSDTLHDLMFLEKFAPNGHGPYDVHLRAVRDDAYKLIEQNGNRTLYPLTGPREGPPIEAPTPADLQARERLEEALDGRFTPQEPP